MRHKLLLLLFPLLLSAHYVNGQNVYGAFASWNAFLAKAELNNQFYVHNEFRYRVVGNPLIPQQFLVRPSLHFKKNKLDFGMGYTYSENYPYGFFENGFTGLEHNIWEQITPETKLGRITVGIRIRYENRFIKSVIMDGYSFANRLRFQPYIKRKLKLFNRIKTEIDFYDEAFMIGSFDALRIHQNWTGSNITFSKGSHAFYAGYMYFWLDQGQVGVERLHILRLGYKLTIKAVKSAD